MKIMQILFIRNLYIHALILRIENTFDIFEHSFYHGLDVKDLLEKLKASQVWFFSPPSHAPPSNAWSTTI
jgi:hypothetical protein